MKDFMVLGTASGGKSKMERPTCIKGEVTGRGMGPWLIVFSFNIAFWRLPGNWLQANNSWLLLPGPHFLGLNLVINCMQSVCFRDTGPVLIQGLNAAATSIDYHSTYFSVFYLFIIIIGSLFWSLFQISSSSVSLAPTDKVLAPFLK